MSEIIKSVGQQPVNSSPNVDARDKQAAVKDVPVATVSRSDTVSLTDTAAQLQSLQKVITSAPAVNQERVESLRAAIADGSYQVDATAIAKSLIDFEQQLGG